MARGNAMTLRTGFGEERARPRPDERVLRRRLVGSAVAALVLATLHFLDHIIRGRLVLSRGLNPAWNHSGWPFQAEVSPAFLASLVTVYSILIVGLVLTLRGRAWAAYWLATAIVLGSLVAAVHFIGPQAELPNVIWDTYGYPVAGAVALVVLFSILGGLVIMAVDAVLVRRASGHW